MDALGFFESRLDLGAALAVPGWETRLPKALLDVLGGKTHGALKAWGDALDRLPEGRAERVELDRAWVTVDGPMTSAERALIEESLRALHPWRKGPYSLFGIDIDTEWRSDRKWDRLSSVIASLKGRRVLDVGCGSGYHGWRMLGHGATQVVGIDPTWLSVVQFMAIRRLAGRFPFSVLPLGIDDLPRQDCFDTVFSMGVLYHRRSPLDHLLELREFLRPGGELVLETLVIEGGKGEVLLPKSRYAQMRNVWFIPTPLTLESWLERTGYQQIRRLDVSATSTEEQRSTAWMTFHSLTDFLDPEDPSRTIEGYPAPVRALFLAEVPALP